MKELDIIKIGGSIVNNEERLTTFIRNFLKVSTPKIIVPHPRRTFAASSIFPLR